MAVILLLDKKREIYEINGKKPLNRLSGNIFNPADQDSANNQTKANQRSIMQFFVKYEMNENQ